MSDRDELTRGSTRKQRVLLVKTDDLTGRLPVGEQYLSLHAPDLDREDALRRAWRLFKREHPDENPMSWTVDRG